MDIKFLEILYLKKKQIPFINRYKHITKQPTKKKIKIFLLRIKLFVVIKFISVSPSFFLFIIYIYFTKLFIFLLRIV